MNDARRRLLERRIIGHGRHGPIYAIAGGAVDADTDAPTEPALPYTLEDLRGKTPEELQKIVGQLDERLRTLHQTPEGELRILDETEKRALKVGLEIRKQAIEMLEEHAKIAEIFRTKPRDIQTPLRSLFGTDDDPFGSIRALPASEARDRALRVLDNRNAAAHLTAPQKDQVDRLVRRYPDIARRVLVTENDHYRSAWMQLVTDPHPMLNDDERRAVQAFNEYRAMSEGTTTAGGFGVPVFIDASIILTAQESANPFLQLARQVEVNTNAWKGVSSAGVSWSFDAEAAAVSDDSPALAQPTVTVFMARGFIPYSIEVGQDYPSFAEEMSVLLASGYDELLVEKFSTGSGSGEPSGILTALDATAASEVLLTTAGSFGEVDLYNTWAALPQKFRRRASWMMNVGVNNAIRRFGTANVFHAYTQSLPAAEADQLFGRGVYESPYFANFTATTGHQNVLVVGDWSNYVVARRGGMAVELVPTLFDITNNRPTGQRGWFAYARIGGGVAAAPAFRLLNQT